MTSLTDRVAAGRPDPVIVPRNRHDGRIAWESRLEECAGCGKTLRWYAEVARFDPLVCATCRRRRAIDQAGFPPGLRHSRRSAVTPTYPY